MVCCSFALASGEESAPGPVYQIDVTEGAGIRVTGLPAVAPDALITEAYIYVSDWNSEQLYYHSTVPIGTTSITLTKLTTTQGVSLRDAIGSSPMPAGKFVTLFNGRIFAAIGKFVVFSDALNYGITRLSTNFYGFGSDVTMLVDTLDGIYVASDKTYFIANAGSKEASQKEVLAYGAVPSAIVRAVDNIEGNVAWFSERGFVIGGPGGQVKNVMDDAIAPKPYTSARAFWRAQGGIKQLVAVAGGGGPQDAFVASDFIDAELVRGTPQ